jgi:GTPase SAR1 family protein
MSQITHKRIAFVVNAVTGKELKAGNRDVSRVYSILTNPKYGGCEGDIPTRQIKTHIEFQSNLVECLKTWNTYDQLIFYFSGHGDVRSQQYCLKLGLEECDWYPFNNIINYLNTCGVSRAILIIDACHSGAAVGFKNPNDTYSRAINQDNIPQGIAIIASSLASQASRELPDGSYSLFTYLFCEGIERGLDDKPTHNGLITVGDIVTYINSKLTTDEKYSEFRQRPVFQVNKADREIWLTKNISGSVTKQHQTSEPKYIRTPEELKFLYDQTLPHLHPCPNASVDELDWELVKQYCESKKQEFTEDSRERLLSLLKLYSPIKHEGRNVLHKSAVLCFHKSPESIYPQAKSVFGFKSNQSTFKREDVCGPLSYQLEKLLELITKYIEKVSFIAEDGLRHEVEEIDTLVIRELISNALAHRDYNLNGTVKVSITPEALEIYSPGKFPDSTSWNDFIKSSYFVSYPVNVAICEYLSNLRTFEGFGRGFETFQEYVNNNGSDSITYSELQGTTTFIRVLRRKSILNLTDISGNSINFGNPSVMGDSNIVIHNYYNDLIPEFDLRRYQEAIIERYGNLQLESLDPTGYVYNELKLWKMFIVQKVSEIYPSFLPIYELPKEDQRKLREDSKSEIGIYPEELKPYKTVDIQQPVHSVLDILNDKQNYKRIVILGDPGSGKSTLLQHIALHWAKKTLDDNSQQLIPLLIELRTYIRDREEGYCNNFLDFSHQSPRCFFHLNQRKLHEHLQTGNVLVMFDGLDEVFDPRKREDVITDIHRFTNEYPNVQVIVTSRVIGYKPQRLRDADFRHFMLQDLDSAQIQDFIYRWHELTFIDEADKVRKRERLQRGIETSKAITELAGNPLLLTMMAILNRNQELPRDRAELYNQASRVLLYQWDVERALLEDKRLDPKTIDYKDKQAMLRQVAYYIQTDEKGLAGNLISTGDLEKILTNYLKSIEVSSAREAARLMINQLRTRNFMLCFSGADYYAFVHRTFLEYFCAWEFVWQFKETQMLTLQELKNEVFGKHWQDESWHAVLYLIAGMIEPKFVSSIIEYLIIKNDPSEKFSNIFIASNCLSEVRNRSLLLETSHKLLNILKNLVITESNNEIRTKAIRTVAAIWREEPSTKTWLEELVQFPDSIIQKAALSEIENSFK